MQTQVNLQNTLFISQAVATYDYMRHLAS